VPGEAGQGEGSSGGGVARSGSTGSPPEANGDSGGGSAQFRGRGDNSVQESGSEAVDSEFAQAAAALHGYLDAGAAGNWKAACSYLSSDFRKSLQQLSPEPCAAALATLSAGSPAAAVREAAVADAGALRVNGRHGFLLFHGAHHSDYFMPMAREGGRWKIAALAASPLA
jgi:hypothetical protein